MIKVKKDLSKIPDCLQNGKAYNCDDVKEELKNIYQYKCCYCETKLSKNYAVEHFRPKQDYKWLEKAWSNLLLVCNSCNSSKGKRFVTENKKLTNKVENIDFHKSAEYLNRKEQQRLLHPEYDNPEEYFEFEKSGKILGKNKNDKRAIYTIDLVKLNHADLIKSRYQIIEKLIKNIKNSVSQSEISFFLREFNKNANNSENYTAYRKYLINNFMKEIITDIFKQN